MCTLSALSTRELQPSHTMPSTFTSTSIMSFSAAQAVMPCQHPLITLCTASTWVLAGLCGDTLRPTSGSDHQFYGRFSSHKFAHVPLFRGQCRLQHPPKHLGCMGMLHTRRTHLQALARSPLKTVVCHHAGLNGFAGRDAY